MSQRQYTSVESLRNRDAFRADESVRQAGADLLRGEFLRKLDGSEFQVSDWEAQFIESFLNFTSNRPSDEPRWWTPGRRSSVDKMMGHYAELAPAGHTPSTVAQTIDRLPAAAAGTCAYLVRAEDRRQVRCGKPAAATVRHGLELCADHERERQAGIARLRQLKERNLRS